MKYEYEFAIHPSRHLAASWPKIVKDIIARSTMTVEILTEAEWNDFRDSAERAGWELHEVARRPHVELEVVRIP